LSATHVNEGANTIAGTHRSGGHGAPHTEDITGHHSGLAHQFDNMEQQRDATTIAMWVFLVTEIMFFGGMFFAYVLYRTQFPDEFAAASYQLSILLGGINTAVLIGSSLTMAMAVYFSQIGNRRLLVWLLIATMILGTAFLVIKGFEYKAKFDHHTFPGINFQLDQIKTGEYLEHHGHETAGLDQSRMQMFFVIYYAMTAVHALHMIIGIAVLAFLTYYAWRGAYSPEYYAPVEMTGLYWHFVDIVWIFLFPLLYLIGRH
jgi:cytochrome c oxidase subunit 3